MVLWLKCGSGPVHLVGSSCGEGVESADEEKEEVKLLIISGKCSAPGSGSEVPQKK